MQTDSYWNVPLLDVPHEMCTDRTEYGRYLTKNFRMADPDFTSIDKINSPNMDLKTARKDNWQEEIEAQSYNLDDVSGRYSEGNDYNTDMICKLLQQQAAPHVGIKQLYGNPINYKYFISIFKEVVEEKIEDPTGKLIMLIKYTDGKAKELEKRYGDPRRLSASYTKEVKNWPPIKYGDATSYQDFYDFLNKCSNNVKCYGDA